MMMMMMTMMIGWRNFERPLPLSPLLRTLPLPPPTTISDAFRKCEGLHHSDVVSNSSLGSVSQCVRTARDSTIYSNTFLSCNCLDSSLLQPYASPTSALLQSYFSSTSATRRLYFSPTSALLQSYFSPTSVLLQPYFDPTSVLLQAYFNPTSALH